MFVLYLENYTQSLRGRIKTYLYEIKPALYVGTVSAQVRDMIWDTLVCQEPDVNAALIYPYKNEQGFDVKTKGDTKRKISDFDGLLAITINEGLHIDILKSKSSPKPLLCHFYESAAIANRLIDGYFNKLAKRLSILTNDSFENIKNIILFFTFLHDIGKIHPAFQFKIIKDVMLDFGYQESILYKHFRHEKYSEKILKDYLRDKYGKSIKHTLIQQFPQIIACHHQRKKDTSIVDPDELFLEMQKEVIKKAEKLYPFQIPETAIPKEIRNGVCELVLGIIHTADWMASSQNVFDDKTPHDFITFNDYLRHLENECDVFLKQNLLDGRTLSEMFAPNTINWKLLIEDFEPRPMQKEVEKLCGNNEASLFFIEDSCGGGKTEAALYYALSQAANITGLYFALPTTATSENMRVRIDKICKAGIGPDFKVPVYNSMAWMQGEEMQLDTNLWENDSKLKLFYPIAVGTVDQLINAVQGVKHSDLTLSALSGKTLIIDEMHAYDAYMLEELKTLFEYCSIMGVSIIVLSATLTSATKKELIMAYNRAKNIDTVLINNNNTIYEDLQLSMQYPLLTKVTPTSIQEQTTQISKSTTYSCDILNIKDDFNKTVVEKAVELIGNGGTAAIILNTVRSSIEVYKYLLEIVQQNKLDIDINLMHSKFSLLDKAQKTSNAINKYGKDRSERPVKSIVVSTQIIEQSMDVDFDFLITEPAPIDLLIQRFGRARRHADKGTIREKINHNVPYVYITKDESGFGTSKYIYDEPILQASLDYIYNHKQFLSPDNVRNAIEEVYLEDNINSYKKMLASQRADFVTIGKVNHNRFWRYENLSALNDDTHTRYESLPTVNIILLSKDMIEQIQNGYQLNKEELKDILKTRMFSSVALNKVRNIDRVSTGNKMLDEYFVFNESQFSISDTFGLEF